MAEMTFGEALDQIRSFHTKFVKPFERLDAVMAVALEVETALPVKQRQLADVTTAIAAQQARLVTLEQGVASMTKEASTAEAAAVARIRAAEATEAIAGARLQQIADTERTRAQTLDRSVTEAADQKRAALEAEMAQRRTALTAEIAGLEDTKREMQIALAQLKQRFGG